MLRLRTIRNDRVTGGVSHGTRVPVGSEGELLFADLAGDTLLHLVTESAQRMISIGRRGEGPGELLQPIPLLVTDSNVTAFDTRTQRLSVWNRDGRLDRTMSLANLQSSAVLAGGGVVDIMPGTEHRWLLKQLAATGLVLTVFNDSTSTSHRLLDSADPFLRGSWPTPSDVGTNPPALGAGPGGFALGNALEYDVAIYDWSGKELYQIHRDVGMRLPTSMEVDTMVQEWRRMGRPGRGSEGDRRRLFARTPLPWFMRDIHWDAHGRLWLIGSSGGTTYADLFARQKYLGRVPIPCRGLGVRSSLQATWLALVCAPPPGDSVSDAMVKLFRIIEQNDLNRASASVP